MEGYFSMSYVNAASLIDIDDGGLISMMVDGQHYLDYVDTTKLVLKHRETDKATRFVLEEGQFYMAECFLTTEPLMMSVNVARGPDRQHNFTVEFTAPNNRFIVLRVNFIPRAEEGQTKMVIKQIVPSEKKEEF
jgi:hypothetical protein